MVNRMPGNMPWESPDDWYRQDRMPWESPDDWDWDRNRRRPGGGPHSPGGSIGPRAVDPGALRGCLYRVTDVRLEGGRRFWFYPTYIGRESAAGYRWRARRGRWEYFGIDLDRIRSFSCR
ncbi:transporter [Bhargavaea cecembensis]|uniref:transporter n=1 Tax=Bhargavaea cecembensis TaxID=394098 RepID=UPI0015CF1FE0|nr:transporter [Bhargavaea cecembensis]